MSAAAALLSPPSDLARIPALRSKRQGPTEPRITPRVRKAILDIVWNGSSLEDAAAKAGLEAPALRRAIASPHVRAALLAEVDVLKSSARPLAARRIIQLAERADSDKVSLDAAKYLDSNGKADQHAINVQVNVQQPGYMIAVDPRYAADVGTQPQPARLTTDAPKPLK